MPADELARLDAGLNDGPDGGLDDVDPIRILLDGDVEVEGRMPWSSNATFLVTVTHGEIVQRAIYKPVRGERPLWDFAPGLHRRERAAYVLSEQLGLGIVPATVLRDDGPFGEGSLQWFVDADHRQHYFTLYEGRPDLHDQLRRIAAFDLLANNTDRKSGHCLLVGERVWGIDHGLCFAADSKLRTVIWDFAGEPIDAGLAEAIAALAEGIPNDLAELLTDDEVGALRHRAELLADDPTLPLPGPDARPPWPLV